MARYESVQWSEGEEVTSEKLNAMASSIDWIKLTSVRGKVHLLDGTDEGATEPVPMGPISSYAATKILALYKRFDTGVPVTEVNITLQYPTPFLKPPIVVAQVMHGGSTDFIMRLWDTSNVDHVKCQVMEVNKESHRMIGGIHAIAFGLVSQ